jgi:TM2 domain-containing membrane protein YozV
MDHRLAAQLRTILPALAAIFFSIAGARLFLASFGRSNILNWVTFATGVASLASWILMRRNRVAADRIQLIALVIGTLIVIHSLAEFYREPDTIQVALIMLLLDRYAWRNENFVPVRVAIGVSGDIKGGALG